MSAMAARSADDPGIIAYGADGTGHAGNATSQARQEEDDRTGRAGRRRRAALQLLAFHQSQGMTAGEFEDKMGFGHGAASSVLSHLQRAGHVTRVTDQRGGMEVYVLPAFVNGRDESPYRPRASYRAEDIRRIERRAMARGYREGFTAAFQEAIKVHANPGTYEINRTNPYETEEKDHGDTDGS